MGLAEFLIVIVVLLVIVLIALIVGNILNRLP